MRNREMSLDEARGACVYKLGAARFHYNSLESASHDNTAAIAAWARNYPSPLPAEVMPIFYHLDAFLYQLSSCFDMLLQIINIKSGILLPEHQVKWNPYTKRGEMATFMKKVEKNDNIRFLKVGRYYQAETFSSLRKTRNHITHRGYLGLYVSYNDDNDDILLTIPGLSYLLLERCEIWGNSVASFVSDIDPELRGRV
jgi:hypothetical protein